MPKVPIREVRSVDSTQRLSEVLETNEFLVSNNHLAPSSPESDLEWNQTFGGTNEDYFESVIEASNGDLLGFGGSRSYGGADLDFWVVRMDDEGNALWNKTYGGTLNDFGFCIIDCSGGGYLLSGSSSSYRTGSSWTDAWLVRIDEDGNEIWAEHYGDVHPDGGEVVVECSTGGFAVAGTNGYWSGASPLHDMQLVRTQDDGTQVWKKKYGGGGRQRAFGLKECSTGGFVLSGYTTIGAGGSIDGYIVRTDADGNHLWNQTYGSTGEDIFYQIVECDDGGFAVCGHSTSYGTDVDVWLVKTDSSGTILWNQTYGGVGSDVAYALELSGTGGFYLTGASQSFGDPNLDCWLIQTDSNGNILRERVYSSPEEDRGRDVIGLGRRGVAVAGWQYQSGDRQGWIIRDRLLASQDPPIEIHSDEDFANQAQEMVWLGDGTSLNPYQIVGHDINATDQAEHCIAISNTTVFFIIQECQLYGASSGAGVFLSNVSHAIILNNTCTQNQYGILGSLGTDNNITNNFCSYNTDYGISLFWTTNSNVTSNLCQYNYIGMQITFNSHTNLIANNTLGANNYVGFFVDSGPNTIEYNIFEFNPHNIIDHYQGSNNDINLNYYSDYTGPDLLSPPDVGDNPHPIPGDGANVDQNPWIVPPGRNPIIWVQTPIDQLWELNFPFYYDLNATCYRGLDQWWLNDTTNFAINTEGIITNSSYLPATVFGLQVWVNDSKNFILSANFTINVQNLGPPTWDPTPTDQNVEYGSRFSYDLHAVDSAGIDYWWINDTTNFQIDSQTGLIEDKFVLPIDSYGIRVWVNDTLGETQTADFNVLVQDTQPPTWLQFPVDRSVAFLVAFQYDLNATDPSGLDTWWVNDTTYFSIDNSGVITNSSTLNLGVYGLQVWVNDTLNHVKSATFSVTVLDNTPPMWLTIPTDQYLELGTGLDIQLEAWDLSGIGQWTINDTTYFAINSTGGITNITTLLIGSYGLEVTVTDIFDNPRTTTFTVIVRDTIPPIWTLPVSDRTVELGAGFTYALEVSDPYGIDTWWINDTIHFSIDSNGRITNATYLTLGSYGLQVWVNDTNGQTQTSTFKVTVQDTTPPSWITTPTDQVILQGQILHYQLEASDLSGIARWEVDDETRFNITQSGYLTSLGSLPVGVYLVEITVYDSADNSLSITITVTSQLDLTALLILGSAVGLVSAVLLIIVFFVLKKKGRILSAKSAEGTNSVVIFPIEMNSFSIKIILGGIP
jgi:hypothetical protein